MKIRAAVLVAVGCLLGRAALGSTQVITNGGFESISALPWFPAKDISTVPVVVNPIQAHSGNNFLKLGNESGDGSGQRGQAVFQNVAMPTNALVARFSYFWGGAIG